MLTLVECLIRLALEFAGLSSSSATMPLAQQPSQQQHHHLFSAIGTFLHARHPSHGSSSSGSNPTHGIAPFSAQVSSGASDVPRLYQAFDSHLMQRLSSLFPTDDPSCFSLSSFNEYMAVLLTTQADLRPLIPASRAQRRTMDEFLERSVKVLDVCRDIKEQIADVESLQGMLRMVASCLISKQGIAINRGNMIRARKNLAQLLLHIGVEKGDDVDSHQDVEMRRSFRGRLRQRLSGHYREGLPQRWRYWHGHQDATVPSVHGNNSTSTPCLHASTLSSASSSLSSSGHGHAPSHAASTLHTRSNSQSHAFEVIRALQALELSLLPPKLVARDEEECFSAAIYTLNVLYVFFLGTITAAFPSLGIKAHVIATIDPPNYFGWTAAFLRLQEKVQEELRVRSRKRGVHAGVWELDELYILTKRLLELTSQECLPRSAAYEEEVTRLVSQFNQHVHQLERDLADFQSQMTDFYNRIASARLEVIDLMNNATWT